MVHWSFLLLDRILNSVTLLQLGPRMYFHCLSKNLQVNVEVIELTIGSTHRIYISCEHDIKLFLNGRWVNNRGHKTSDSERTFEEAG